MASKTLRDSLFYKIAGGPRFEKAEEQIAKQREYAKTQPLFMRIASGGQMETPEEKVKKAAQAKYSKSRPLFERIAYGGNVPMPDSSRNEATQNTLGNGGRGGRLLKTNVSYLLSSPKNSLGG